MLDIRPSFSSITILTARAFYALLAPIKEHQSQAALAFIEGLAPRLKLDRIIPHKTEWRTYP